MKTSTADTILTAACCRSEVRRGNYTTERRIYQMLFSLQNTSRDSTVNSTGMVNARFSGQLILELGNIPVLVVL